MKRYIVLLLSLALYSLSALAQSEQPTTEQSAAVHSQQTSSEPTTFADNNAAWEGGNAAYNEGRYSIASDIYESILSSGEHSAKLYYNLGNAYFKQEMLGKAILNYNRALRLAPSDEDIRHNLEYAEQATKDNIEQIPVFFLTAWSRTVRNIMGGNAWTIISLMMLSIALLSALAYQLAQRISLRKMGFYAMVVAAVLFIISSTFAYQQRQSVVNSQEAIVMSSAVSVKSSPDRAATDLFVIHEGTKLSLGEKINGWQEIRIADGRKGWVESSRIEII